MRKVLVFVCFIICCSQLIAVQWSNSVGNNMEWEEAFSFCQNLGEGGHGDWRMPNIDELRSTIINNSYTQKGGACKVSQQNKCLQRSCLQENLCQVSITCDGCKFSKFGDTGWFWSSSARTDEPRRKWGINFNNGTISNNGKGKAAVRCVR